MEFQVVSESPGWYRIELVEGGNKLSWLSVPEIKMHYGNSVVAAGGIAGVYTPREYRKKGYSASTLKYSVKWMKEKGYSISALFGILDYYHKFGFAGFMAEHTATTPLKYSSYLSSEDYDWEISEDPAFASDTIVKIYERANTSWPASRVRDPNTWKGFRKGVSWEHSPKVLVLRDSREVVAYAALERWSSLEALQVAEVGAKSSDRKIYSALLKRIYSLAFEGKWGKIEFHLPPSHPMANLLIPYTVEIKSTYLWSGGGMARVINLTTFLEEVKNELCLRSNGLNGEVTIEIVEPIDNVENETATIKVKDGDVEISNKVETVNKVKIGPGEALQLVLGYRDILELFGSSEVRGEVGLLDKLFPRNIPYVWQPDRW